MMGGACCARRHESPRIVRWLGGVLRWLIPGTVLALVPKCPACVAAYIALWTGLGLSMTTAAYLRTGLIVLCIASLAYLSARAVWRLLAARLKSKGALL